MTEHLFADFSYSRLLDTYLWKQMMQMSRKLIHIWYSIDKKHRFIYKKELSQVFVVIYGIPLFSQKIKIHVQNSVKSICIHRSLLAEL